MAEGKSIYILSEKLAYRFSDINVLKTALTHASYSYENSCESYERLEFLGDAVIEIVISDLLFCRFPKYTEGELTEARKHLVCENTLSLIARKLSLGDYLRLGKGEETKGGRMKNSILSDIFEALIAAIYLDSGKRLDEVEKFLLPLIEDELENCLEYRDGDYKTELCKIVEQDGLEKLSYVVTGKRNCSNNSVIFTVNAMLNSNVIGMGVGKKIKDAENQAARQALILFGFYSENDK